MSKPTGKLLFAYQTIAGLEAERDTLHAANQRLEDDYKEAVADGMEAARQIHRLEGEVKRLRDALVKAEAMLSELDYVGDMTELGKAHLAEIRAALLTANGEVAE